MRPCFKKQQYFLLCMMVMANNWQFCDCHCQKPALCQVYFFAECPIKYTRQNKHSTKCVFVECLFSGTRQICILPSAIFQHTAKCVFAECLFLALGKYVFCRVLFFGTRQNASLPSAFFLALDKDVFCRVSLFWHSAKRHFAVCIFLVGQISFSKQFLRL